MAVLTDNMQASSIKKVRKSGPFRITPVEGGPHFLAALLSNALAQIEELPDFSDDRAIFCMTDFGGEHKGALNNTYSFLIVSQSKLGPFSEEMQNLRVRRNLLSPYQEFSYKDVEPGPKGRALPEFFDVVDGLLHGVVLTIAVDKRVGSFFGEPRKVAYSNIVRDLAELGMGTWKGPEAEKVLRVSNMLAAVLSVLASPGHKMLWYCDNDAINANGKKRTFEHTQKIFTLALGTYIGSQFEMVGFAKPFDGKSHLDDLLSVADMAAGVVSDILDGHARNNEIEGKDEKVHVIKWIGQSSAYLSKVVIHITPLPNGDIGSGVVQISRK